MDCDNSEIIYQLSEILTEYGNISQRAGRNLSSISRRIVVIENLAWWHHDHGDIQDVTRMGPCGMSVYQATLSLINEVCNLVYTILRERGDMHIPILEGIFRARQYYLYPDLQVDHIYLYGPSPAKK